MSRLLSHDEFVENMKACNPTKIILGKYVANRLPVRVRCSCGRVSSMLPGNLYAGRGGCRFCNPQSTGMSHDEFVRRVKARHGDHIILQGRYTLSKNRIKAICSGGHKLNPIAGSLLGDGACKKCDDISRRFSHSQVLKLLPKNIQLMEKYQGTNKSHQFQCLDCKHVWTTKPTSILNHKSGCPICNSKTGAYGSRPGHAWLDMQEKELGIRLLREYRIPESRLRVDGFHPKSNTVFEFYGDAAHGNPKMFHFDEEVMFGLKAGRLYGRTQDRERKIKALGYKLVTIWERDFKKLRHHSK